VYKDIEKKPIQVTFKRPELPGTTAIMMIENPGKEVFRIRELLKEACSNSEVLKKYKVKCDVPGTTHFPNIVHSSIARFKRPPKGSTCLFFLLRRRRRSRGSLVCPNIRELLNKKAGS